MKPKESWYEILGVAPEATDDEIREAWRAKTAAGPGTPRFADFNAAAGVLLDPKRRAEYDRSIAPEPAKAEAETAGGSRIRPPARVFALMALFLVVVGLVVAAIVAQSEAAKGGDVASARTEALVQVNAAIPSMSYDYSTNTTPQVSAGRYMTPSYRAKYEQLVDYGVKLPSGEPGRLVSQKASAAFAVKDAAVLTATAKEVSVLVYVNETEKNAGQPVTQCGGGGICQNRVVVTLVKTDGQWLIDNLKPF